MKNHSVSLLGLAIFGLFVSTFAVGAKWEVDPAHSTAKFKVRHLTVTNVHGSFKDIKGELNIDDKDMTKTTANITINPATVNTDNTKRDDHLKGADFFDTTKFKTIAFKSKKMEKAGDKWEMTGDLTMHGVTKDAKFTIDEITAPVKGFDGTPKRGLSGTAKINRSDWGLKWNSVIEGGGFAVSDTVDITVEFELNGQKEASGKKS